MTTHYKLTGFQRDLLEAIAAVADEPYGLALKDYPDERYADPINHSRISQNLIARDEPHARTNEYTLADAGRDLLWHQAETLAGLCDQPHLVAGGDRQ